MDLRVRGDMDLRGGDAARRSGPSLSSGDSGRGGGSTTDLGALSTSGAGAAALFRRLHGPVSSLFLLYSRHFVLVAGAPSRSSQSVSWSSFLSIPRPSSAPCASRLRGAPSRAVSRVCTLAPGPGAPARPLGRADPSAAASGCRLGSPDAAATASPKAGANPMPSLPSCSTAMRWVGPGAPSRRSQLSASPRSLPAASSSASLSRIRISASMAAVSEASASSDRAGVAPRAPRSVRLPPSSPGAADAAATVAGAATAAAAGRSPPSSPPPPPLLLLLPASPPPLFPVTPPLPAGGSRRAKSVSTAVAVQGCT